MRRSAIAVRIRQELAKVSFDFDALALEVFRHQFDTNRAYRRWCRAAGKSKEAVASIEDIPFLPTDIFKNARIACFPHKESYRELASSGTGGLGVSRHPMNKQSWDMYVYFSLRDFLKKFPHPTKRYALIALHPRVLPGHTTKLSTFFRILGKTCKRARFMPGALTTDEEKLRAVEALRDALTDSSPVFLCTNSKTFIDMTNFCRQKGIRVPLPRGSRTVMNGGFKKVPVPAHKYAALKASAAAVFALPARSLLQTYSGAELTGRALGRVGEGFTPPPWWRISILNPKTLQPQAKSAPGVVRVIDLLSFDTCSFLIVPDRGYIKNGRLFILGRADSRGYKKLVAKVRRALL